VALRWKPDLCDQPTVVSRECQPYATATPAVIVLTSALYRSTKKYINRAYRYVLRSRTRHAERVARRDGAGTRQLSLGGFFDDVLAALLGADAEEQPPLYAVAGGTQGTDDPTAVRLLK
jgi:hypothetical protein